jgi:hypothetical protein
MTVTVDFYAIVSQRFTNYGMQTGKSTVRVTRNKPDCDATEVAVKISLELPDALFKRPSLQATIKVNDDVAPVLVDADVADNIARVVKEQMGIHLHVTAPDPLPSNPPTVTGPV